MEKDYYMNSAMLPFQYEQTMPMWNSLSSEQPVDCFMNPTWDHHHHKSTDDQYSSHLSSALTSMVVSSSSATINESFALGRSIGNLGAIDNSSNFGPPFPDMTTALTPPCSTPVMDHILNRNTRSSHPLPALSADPGFAERAARFSCFGSRSFNGRISQLGCNNGELSSRSLAKLPRVVSSPALKQEGSLNSGQTQMDTGPKNGLVSDCGKNLSRLSGSGANSNDSSVSEQAPSCEAGDKAKAAPGELHPRKRKAISRGKAKEDAPNQAGEPFKVAEADDNATAKRSKPTEGNGSENNGATNEETSKSNANGAGDESKKTPEPPKDYIHVRARRGQATDSHSLAERVRREKISERMKLLQDLVPGCNKVTGKALMLDEIINYVQALQRQVEFLSMKLASVNPRMDFDLDNVMSKDMFQPTASLPHPMYPLDSSATVIYGHHQPQQTPQLHTDNTSGGSVSQCPVDPLGTSLCHNLAMQLPPLNGFGEGLPQIAALCEDELQSIVQMGFTQKPNGDLPYHSQGFPVADQASHMKVEL